MAGIVFRKSALDKISSLDQLDQTMKVVKPYDFISVIAILVIILAALVWSIVGSIPEQVTAMGVLISSDDVIDVTYTNQGSVKHVFVERGDYIRNGEVIARIERTDMLDQITQTQTTIDNLLKTQELLNQNTKNGISKERRMRELFEKGLITENDYVASKQTSLDIDRQVNEKKHELAVLKENYQKATRVVSPTTGIVLEVSVDKNDYVNAGTTIALIGKDKSSPSEAILFISATDGKKIEQGMNIGIIPSTVKREEYGYIQGIVTEVSDYPVTEAYMSTVLKNSMLTRTFSQIQNPVEVRASIIPDPTTPSGYKWSSSKGPNKRMSPGIMCSSTITVDGKRPIELVVPLFKKKVLGIGADDNFEIQPPMQQMPQ